MFCAIFLVCGVVFCWYLFLVVYFFILKLWVNLLGRRILAGHGLLVIWYSSGTVVLF